MKTGTPRFQKYLFVCENTRDEGDCCMPEGARLRESLKEAVKRRGLGSRVRVSRSGCLDLCAEGPNVLLMPDNVWFSRVSLSDLEQILHETEKGSEVA
jgi:(2Fe-2S) ferredoxin